jgi:hypothetical protein
MVHKKRVDVAVAASLKIHLGGGAQSERAASIALVEHRNVSKPKAKLTTGRRG